ncbi:MAG: monovalent cation/H+ antiporter subunit A [Pseudomonadota bacterium]
MTLLLIILFPLLGAALPAVAVRWGRNASAGAAAGVTAIPLALLLFETPRVLAGGTIEAGWRWVPAIGLDLTFRLDGLGFLFALLILGIGLLVILYARYYLSQRDPVGRFYVFLLLFMGAMLGIVLSDNLLLLLVFWELTSLSSFLLIGYWKHHADARQGARMALAITGGGGLALLAGVLLLGHIVGSFELPVVLRSRELIQGSPLYLPMLTLILLGAFTKSAQFPFHFWLPHAMSAPTPVSAYLHSATMVKAGVFLLARLYPVLSGSDAWFYLVSGTGLVTLVFAAYVAMFKHDLKGLLAYSTISHLGLIMLLFGLSTPLAAVAGVFHIINHATFKASLFMAAGIIDHESGSRDMRRLNGLWKYMPHTATLAMVAAASMAGVPLFNGFLSKEMFFTEALELHQTGTLWWIVPAAATLAGVFAVAYSLRFIHDVFFNGEPVDLPRTPHEPPRWMKVPVEILVVLCLLVGIFPAYTVAPLLNVAAGSVLGGPLPEFDLAIWHGFTFPLLMSVVALSGGVLVYFALQYRFNLHMIVQSPSPGRRFYNRGLAWLTGLSEIVTGGLQNGSLQRYLALLVTVILLAGAFPFWQLGWYSGSRSPGMMDGGSGVAWLLLVVSAACTVIWHRQRLLALVFVGVTGLMVSLIFVRFSAPDLALTQILVEVVSIILLLLALYLLPQTTPRESSVTRRMRDAGLAVAAGLGAAGLVWAVLTRPQDTISGFFLEQSVPGGGGSNVVNVILVDFRGFDTFGEIIVLAIAALGIYAMIGGLRVERPALDPARRPWAADSHPLLLRVASRILLPLALMVSVYLLLRGHNEPGGGFIAGLVTAVALITQYLASGIAWTEARLRLDHQRMIGIGVLIAALTGVASWFFGAPFLTSAFAHWHLPVLGELPLASAMIFDLGVYLTVVATTMLMLVTLGKIGAREEV